MRVRPFSVYDLEKVNRIYQEHHHDNFGAPSLDRTLRAVVVEANENDRGLGPRGDSLAPSGGEIVAFGMLSLIPEAIMVLDLGQKESVKVKALKSLIHYAKITAKTHGYGGCHAFVQGDFADKLKEHFGFTECKGQALYLDVE